MTKKTVTDEFDLKILNVVQKDNQLTHAQIGEQIGMSTSSVRRRLTRLRKDGIIIADAARVDPNAFGVTLIVTVSFGTETPETYDAFDKQMRELEHVKQSYHIAGEADYLLIVHGPSLQWYETWAKEVLMSNDMIRRYSTIVSWDCKKFETAISLPASQ